MRKLAVVVLALAVVGGFSSVSWAAIAGSAHDFSGQDFANGQICLPCHAPHNNNPDVTDAPLWNHDLSTAVYDTYSSPTLDANGGTLGQPGGVSSLCLSCHDGTVAIDAFGGNTGTVFIGADANLGTDLSNDHPISFTYDTALATADGGLEDPVIAPSGVGTTGGTIADDMLIAGLMECSSCHEPHAEFIQENLLLKANGNSALCLTCHVK